MKTKYIFLLVIFCGMAGIGLAQKKLMQSPYHPGVLQASVADFLRDLNRQTGIVLEYSIAHFDTTKIIRLKGNESTVGAALQQILHGQYLKLLEHNNKIILMPSSTPFTLPALFPARYSVYGYIKESATQEPLISATVYEPFTGRGVVSNTQGYFNFLLPEGNHTIIVSYGGLKAERLSLDLRGNIRKDIAMVADKDTLPTIVVQSGVTVKEGAVKVSGEQANTEGMMNEDDPLQYLYLSPGLQNASYSFNGLQVRGGGTDENLFLLDGNPIYNPTHLLGAISILNPTVIKYMRIYKSDFPARLGGSLSSVLDVYSKQGNLKNWQGEINAGMLAASLTLEGPVVKDRVALMFSGRKNIPLPFYNSLQDGVRSDFYDVHFRLSAIVNPRHSLNVNFYKGGDRLRHQGKYTYNLNQWGNTTGSAGWNYVLGSRSFINTSINYSEYRNLSSYQYSLFENDTDADEAEIETDDDDIAEDSTDDLSIETKYIGTYSNIKNYNLSAHAEIHASRRLRLNTGIKGSQTTIKPFDGMVTNTLEEDETDFVNFHPIQFEELSLYVETELKPSARLFIKPGLHASAYQLKQYRTIAYQPRLFVSYRIRSAHRLYASYSKMNQFLHLVTNPYAGVNRDLWVPATENLQPEESEIYNIGYDIQLKRKWRFSLEGYYKLLKNVTNYAEGKSTFINSSNWEQNIELGQGRSYGTELILKKTGQRLSWQAGYGLSWSWRQFNSINNGREFPYKYDRRHTAHAGLSFALSPKIDVTGLWSFATGNLYSGGGLVFSDTLLQIPENDPINAFDFIYRYAPNDQYRAKSFQRYDVSVIFHSLKGKKWYASVKAGVYNINGAEGQYSYNVKGSVSSKSIRIKTGSNAFSIIPYLSCTIKF